MMTLNIEAVCQFSSFFFFFCFLCLTRRCREQHSRNDEYEDWVLFFPILAFTSSKKHVRENSLILPKVPYLLTKMICIVSYRIVSQYYTVCTYQSFNVDDDTDVHFTNVKRKTKGPKERLLVILFPCGLFPNENFH